MSNQLYLDVTDGRNCPECGIPLREDYRHYRPATVIRVHRKLGVCVACMQVGDEHLKRGQRDVGRAASVVALRAVWDGWPCLGRLEPGAYRFLQESWPTMEEFSPCMDAQLSSADAAFRTVVLLEHAAGILLEEILPSLEARKSAG